MENRKNIYNKFQCPCCEYYTFDEELDNTFIICPVCFWEDDGIQLINPDYSGGANKVSLKDAKTNFGIFGSIDPKYKKNVRPPNKEEM